MSHQKLQKPESRAGGEERTLYTYGTNDDDILSLEDEGQTPWEELSLKQKVHFVAFMGLKILAIFILMYFFICSLDLLSVGFRILGGTATMIIADADMHSFYENVYIICMLYITLIEFTQEVQLYRSKTPDIITSRHIK